MLGCISRASSGWATVAARLFQAQVLDIERSAVVTLWSAAALYIGRYAYAEPSYKRWIVHWSKGRMDRIAPKVARSAQVWHFSLLFQGCRRLNLPFSQQMYGVQGSSPHSTGVGSGTARCSIHKRSSAWDTRRFRFRQSATKSPSTQTILSMFLTTRSFPSSKVTVLASTSAR